MTTQTLHPYPNSWFHPPPIAVPVALRMRLLDRLVGDEAHKVALVAAPGGYGKTVLLTQVRDALAERGRRCVWLSITEATGDGALLELLWVAADRAGLPSVPDMPLTANSLMHRIERCAEPVIFFIDGLNAGTIADADDILRRLIDGALPNTRFLIAAESLPALPTVRLEASGLLRRIGAADLALTPADVADLGQMTDLPDWAPSLNQQVEGWPAIVQLALSRHREAPELGQPSLTGRQPDIAAFFEQDILRALQPDQRDRLLDASVVDPVCGDLVDALSGGGEGSATLGDLMAHGVPIRPSGRGDWFRLHPLLRDYLYGRLERSDKPRLTRLHQRAANWLLAAGHEQAALRHATASGDIDFLRTIYQGLTVKPTLASDRAGRLHGGRDSLIALENNAPVSDGGRIIDLIQSGQLDLARQAIAQARRRPPVQIGADRPDSRPSEQPAAEPAEWELTYCDLLLRVFDDRLPRPEHLEALRDRLMRTPSVPPSIPAAVSEFIVVARFRRGDFSGVAEVDPDLWHTHALAPMQSQIYVLMELGIAALETGDPDLAGRHLTNARARALDAFGPNAPHAYAASTLLAEVAFERGEREASTRMLQDAFPRLKPEQIWFNLAAAAFTTDAAAAAHISWNDAVKALDSPPALSTHIGLWRLPPLLVAERLRLAVLCGEDLEAARKDRTILGGLGLLELGDLDSAGFGWRVCVPAQLAAIRFDIADGRPDAALARALALRPMLEARRHVRRLIELNLVQGRALTETGDQAGGLSLVRAALRLSVDSGMVRSLMEEGRFLSDLLDDLLLAGDLLAAERALLNRLAARRSRPAVRLTRYSAAGRTFDLSNREAQLLRALVTGKTFKEISFDLDISVNTTKMHRSRLYRKLGCNSRSHAVSLAQALVSAEAATPF